MTDQEQAEQIASHKGWVKCGMLFYTALILSSHI